MVKIRAGDMFDMLDGAVERLRVYFATSTPDESGEFTARLSDRDPDYPAGKIRTFNIETMPSGWMNYGEQTRESIVDLDYGKVSEDDLDVYDEAGVSMKTDDMFGFMDDGFRVYTAVSDPDREGDFVAQLSEDDPEFNPEEFNMVNFNINNMPLGFEHIGAKPTPTPEPLKETERAEVSPYMYAAGALILVLVLNG